MTRNVYIAPDGQRFYYIPSSYNGLYHLTASNIEKVGWTIEEETIEPAGAPSISEALREKEAAFVRQLNTYATGLHIVLAEVPSEQITIQGLVSLARTAGASDASLQAMQNTLMLLAFDIMAENGNTWQRTWEDLKARIPEYLEDLSEQYKYNKAAHFWAALLYLVKQVLV